MTTKHQTQPEALAQQAQLIAALDAVVSGLEAYAITRATAASKLHAALSMRHRDHQLQQPPPTIYDRQGFGYGARLERIAYDFAGSAPLTDHIAHLTAIVLEMRTGLPQFHQTHPFRSLKKSP